MSKKISVIGSGSWGVALAYLLHYNGHEIKIWSYSQEEADMINNEKKCKFLPDIDLPDNFPCYTSLEDTLKDTEIILIVTPSNAIRTTLMNMKPYVKPNQVFVLCSKGMEPDTQKVYTEVIKEIYPDNKIAALSGPSHAEEVIKLVPTVVVVASDDSETLYMIQDTFMCDVFRVYTSTDLYGVELGGSLKNIIALCCGIAVGLGFGDNTIAAIITRGLLEISRIGVAVGANMQTFYGLAGLGDLIVTCSSELSRNRKCGYLIGKGYSIDDAKKEVGMVVEGINAVDGAYVLIEKHNIYAPIIREVYDIIHNGKTAREATERLMARDKKDEF